MLKFEEVTVTDPQKAIDVLFEQALHEIPELSAEQYQKAFKRMQPSSAGGAFKEGTENSIKKIILKNAKRIAKNPGFNNFTVNICTAKEGYEGEEAAQLWAWEANGGHRVHIWKTANALHVTSSRAMLA